MPPGQVVAFLHGITLDSNYQVLLFLHGITLDYPVVVFLHGITLDPQQSGPSVPSRYHAGLLKTHTQPVLLKI